MSSLADQLFEIVTNMDDATPPSGGAAVSTWLQSYLQAFLSASFQVSSTGLKSKHLTYINVVRNTKKNFFFFFCRAPFFPVLDYYNSRPPGGAQALPAPLRSALLFHLLHLYMPEVSNLISKIFLVSITSTMSLINLKGFFFKNFFVNYFSGFRHICKQQH